MLPHQPCLGHWTASSNAISYDCRGAFLPGQPEVLPKEGFPQLRSQTWGGAGAGVTGGGECARWGSVQGP